MHPDGRRLSVRPPCSRQERAVQVTASTPLTQSRACIHPTSAAHPPRSRQERAVRVPHPQRGRAPEAGGALQRAGMARMGGAGRRATERTLGGGAAVDMPEPRAMNPWCARIDPRAVGLRRGRADRRDRGQPRVHPLVRRRWGGGCRLMAPVRGRRHGRAAPGGGASAVLRCRLPPCCLLWPSCAHAPWATAAACPAASTP